MLHDSCMFCTGLGRSVPYALGVCYRISDARRGFASVKLMDVGLSGRLTSFVGLWVEGLRLRAGGLFFSQGLLLAFHAERKRGVIPPFAGGLPQGCHVLEAATESAFALEHGVLFIEEEVRHQEPGVHLHLEPSRWLLRTVGIGTCSAPPLQHHVTISLAQA